VLSEAAVAILVISLVAAAVSDALRYRIPNTICLAVAGAFFLYAGAAALPLGAVGVHAAAGLAVLAVAAAGFALRMMGGGDAKLIAAVALWLGFRNLLPFLLLMAILGGVLGLALILARRLAPQPVPHGRWWSRLLSRGSGVPYGIAISLAALLLLARFPGELLP
jgi:prepilin peptidase CpaA